VAKEAKRGCMRYVSGWRQMAALMTALLGLAGCAQAIDTTEAPKQESGLQRVVREMLASQAAGRLGDLHGTGVITGPVAVFMTNGEVSLIPNSPELGAVLAKIHQRWMEGRRQPLPLQEFQRAFLALTAQRVAVKELGGESLVRFAKTDEKGQYRFDQVPEGQWRLVGSMNSQVSALLWAVPVEVQPGTVSEISLSDLNILLEARTEKAEARPAP